MTKFFRPGDARCPIYRRTRDRIDGLNTSGREFIETLWLDCAAFLDPDALQRATQNMPAVFWELYLAHALNSSGVSLQPQRRTKQNQKGPDLFAVNPDVWIEAVMPEPGTGPDALDPPPLGQAYNVPVGTFILRLCSVFERKAEVMTRYMKDGLIQPGHAAVIAISGALLPTAISESPVPRIVRAILGVGDMVLNIDRNTKQVGSRSIAHNGQVEKANGSPVRTNPFLDPAYSHISAVVYSASDWVTHPARPGVEFVVIHNDNATTKLPRGWLSVGDEYWRENSELHSTRHSSPTGAR